MMVGLVVRSETIGDRVCQQGVVMRDAVSGASDTIAQAVRRFERSHEECLKAVAKRERLAGQVERQIVEATDGLTFNQWNSVRRRCRINTTADSRAVARAVRADPSVHRAAADAERVGLEADGAVLAAKAELACAAKLVLRHGALSQRLIGVGVAELRNFARSRVSDAGPSAA